ncbi:MAG: META domain-containing protein [Betaproteobacteria bacterium]|nr:META domain-containing protein [Betaproteobacteria bacterium]
MNRHAPIALAALVLLAACEFAPVKREPPPLPFTGTKWMLVTERKLEKPPYLEFGDGAVTGFGGCNRVMGRYVQDAVGAGAIVFSSIASARMMCEPVLMTIEDRILAVLRSSTSVHVKANTLQLDGSAGTLRFIAEGTELPPLPPK